MSGIGGCRSSFGFTADATIYSGEGKLISIHGLAAGTDEAYVRIYDNNSASSNTNANLIGSLYVGSAGSFAEGAGGAKSTEADMHGVLFKAGLYADVTHVSGTGSVFTIEFN